MEEKKKELGGQKKRNRIEKKIDTAYVHLRHNAKVYSSEIAKSTKAKERNKKKQLNSRQKEVHSTRNNNAQLQSFYIKTKRRKKRSFGRALMKISRKIIIKQTKKELVLIVLS